MSGTEIRRFSDERSFIGSRWIITLLQAISTSLAVTLALPLVIVTAWVGFATTNLYRIALIPLLAFGLWNLGALVASIVSRSRLHQRPWAFGGQLVRTLAMVAIAWLVYSPDRVQNQLRWFLVALGIWGFASGFSSVPLESLLQKSFESSKRAQVFTSRVLWGLITAVLGGFVIHSVFSSSIATNERAFSYLFMTAAGCFASGTFFTLLIPEPTQHRSSARHIGSSTLLGGLTDRAFRRYLLFRIVLAAVAMLDVFIVIFAIQHLQFDRAFLGIYVITFSTALAISLPLTRTLAARKGGRAVLQTASWFGLITPVLLLTIPYLQKSTSFTDRFSDGRIFLWIVSIGFAALGAHTAFLGTGNFQYLTEITPVVDRARYFDTTNFVSMLTTLFAFPCAWILIRWDYSRFFAITAAIALVSVLLSGMLVDNRVVASRPITARLPGRVSIRELRR